MMGGNVTDMTDRLPHRTEYVACMECGHDWMAVFPASAPGPFECGKCGQMAGEVVKYDDLAWFTRFMGGAPSKGIRERKTLVLLIAKRIREEGE